MCMKGPVGIEYEILSFMVGRNLCFLCQMLNYSSGSQHVVPGSAASASLVINGYYLVPSLTYRIRNSESGPSNSCFKILTNKPLLDAKV